jgi:Peptidase family M23
MRPLRWLVVVACSAGILAAPGRAGAAPPVLIPPVDGAVGRRFEAPQSDYGRGHRGIDYEVAPGSAVRASAAGTVTFAGNVAGTGAVSIEHAGGLSTTYSMLEAVYVRAGERVDAGRWIGTAARSHPGEVQGLHLGVKLFGRYVDPESFLGPLDVGRAIHLAPMAESYAGRVPDEAARAMHEASLRPCSPARPVADAPSPPNDNIAVAIAGISSRTDRARQPGIYRSYLSHALGYPQERVYAFSYLGTDGPHLHEAYGPAATFGDLRDAAARLRLLLAEIARAHPGADVDLVAHSQGGIVARVLLESLVDAWEPGLPRIEHLVTFAAPHSGTPLAAAAEAVASAPPTAIFVAALSAAARRGWLGVPDARAEAVAQLRPDSELVAGLAREDVAFGTRVLSLAMAHDLIVPADRTSVPHEDERIVAPSGLWGHSAILRSSAAAALAYGFLRDAPASCPSAWDGVARVFARALGVAYGAVPELLPLVP